MRSVILARVVQSLAMTAALSLITGAASADEKVISHRNQRKVPKTPLAAYQKEVTDRIEQLWYTYTNKQKDLIVTGVVTLNFRIESNGRVTNLKVVSNTSNELFAQICVHAVMNADLPALPDAVQREAGHDFLDWQGITFSLYPN